MAQFLCQVDRLKVTFLLTAQAFGTVVKLDPIIGIRSDGWGVKSPNGIVGGRLLIGATIPLCSTCGAAEVDRLNVAPLLTARAFVTVLSAGSYIYRKARFHVRLGKAVSVSI